MWVPLGFQAVLAKMSLEARLGVHGLHLVVEVGILPPVVRLDRAIQRHEKTGATLRIVTFF